jgi:hypothetical protein
MADSSTNIPQISSGQSAKEVILNRLTDSASGAMLWARKDESCTGLTWAFRGGRYGSTLIADDDVALTDNATNYVVAARSNGVVSVSTSTTNWNDSSNYFRLYLVTTLSGVVDDYEDHRDFWTASTAATIADGDKGDITIAAGVWTIDNDVVTNAKLNNMSSQTIKGRTTGGSGDPEDLTATQATAILNAMVGDSGAGGTKGLVPAPGSGDAAAAKFLKADATWAVPSTSIAREIQVACSDLTTALTTGTGKAVFRAPRAMTVSGVRASLGTAQASGSIFTVDINEAGTTILSTALTIDNTEKTSTTAATPAVVSDASIADDAEIRIDIDQVGDGTAKGLIVTIYYT